jgi:hypothetical protein
MAEGNALKGLLLSYHQVTAEMTAADFAYLQRHGQPPRRMLLGLGTFQGMQLLTTLEMLHFHYV